MRNLFRPFFRSSEETEGEGGRVKELDDLTGSGPTSNGRWNKDGNATVLSPSDEVNNAIEPAYRKLPLISGIIVPFSLLLSIPGLTGHWYVRTDGAGIIIETRQNTVLLDASMGISLACGVLANACLVVRFSERNVKLMTLLCIFWLTIHDVINILVVTIFGLEHRFDDGFTYGQPFWLTVCSTIASTSTNLALISDYKHTRQFQFKGSGLTHKQRSLMIAIIILLSYLALGSLVQAIMLKITFIEALYFSVVSIETIGFGDIHPDSTGTRVFTVFYVSVGILNLALTVALAREALLEEAAVSFQARIAALRNRVLHERMRYRWKNAIRSRLQAQGAPVWIPQDDLANYHKNSVDSHRLTSVYMRSLPKTIAHTLKTHLLPASRQEGTHLYRPRPRQLNVQGLSQMQLESAAEEAGISVADIPLFATPQRAPEQIRTPTIADVPASHRWLGEHRSWTPTFITGAIAPDRNHMTLDDEDSSATANMLETGGGDSAVVQDADSLSRSIAQEERSVFAARLALAWILFIAFWMIGSLIFMKTEGWGFGTSVYFCFVSFTTVGYGELSPQTPAGRAIFVAWALVGVATMTILLSILSDAYSRRYKAIIKTDEAAILPHIPETKPTLFPTVPASSLAHHPLPYEVLQCTKNLQDIIEKYKLQTDEQQLPMSWIPAWSRRVSQPDDEQILKDFARRLKSRFQR